MAATFYPNTSRAGLTVSALASGASSPGSTPGRFMLQEPEISGRLISHLPRMQT